jgi:hypothetical protein
MSERPPSSVARSPEKTLRRLFLTLFLRGRTSRGLRRQTVPKSVWSKLTLTLILYAMVGAVALVMVRQPLLAFSLYLHSMAFALIGMFVASSAGEILFNQQEADILLHRPIEPRALLWAKIGVLVEVSLWLAAAFNLVGFAVGIWTPDGGPLYPLVHAVSTALLALLCTGSVVLAYQLCLRWFGREKLDGLMTSAQVFVAVAAVLGGQMPRFFLRARPGGISLDPHARWLALLPPAWFAGFDDALAGSGEGRSWLLAAVGLIATGTVLWIAFGRLADDYGTGLQKLGEVRREPRRSSRRRTLDVLVNNPPLRWFLRDPVARSSFLLVGAYLARDRDVKLRVYPSLASILAMPAIFLFQDGGRHGNGNLSEFGTAFSAAYIGLAPMMALGVLQYSQNWQASDLFRTAPIRGPGSIAAGAQSAISCFLTLPLVALLGTVAWILRGPHLHPALLLPGVLALPLFTLAPTFLGVRIPFSAPPEEAKGAGRGLWLIGAMLVSFAVAGLGMLAWSYDWFLQLIAAEILVVAVLYLAMRASLSARKWEALED